MPSNSLHSPLSSVSSGDLFPADLDDEQQNEHKKNKHKKHGKHKNKKHKRKRELADRFSSDLDSLIRTSISKDVEIRKNHTPPPREPLQYADLRSSDKDEERDKKRKLSLNLSAKSHSFDESPVAQSSKNRKNRLEYEEFSDIEIPFKDDRMEMNRENSKEDLLSKKTRMISTLDKDANNYHKLPQTSPINSDSSFEEDFKNVDLKDYDFDDTSSKKIKRKHSKHKHKHKHHGCKKRRTSRSIVRADPYLDKQFEPLSRSPLIYSSRDQRSNSRDDKYDRYDKYDKYDKHDKYDKYDKYEK